MNFLWVFYEVESTVIGCSFNDNNKLIECIKVGLQQMKFKWPPYVKVWFMPTNWLAKTMSKILSPKMCEVILTKWHQSLHQWTHNIGYDNKWVKSQHTLSTRTCEWNSIVYVVITLIKNCRKLQMNVGKVKVSKERT